MKKETKITEVFSEVSIDSQISQKYHGILPCTSCNGIETELILFNDFYELREVYMGDTNSAPIMEKGRLAVHKGFENDENAMLYILNPNNSVFRRYYINFIEDNEIVKLDKDMKRIDSEYNYSLKKVK